MPPENSPNQKPYDVHALMVAAQIAAHHNGHDMSIFTHVAPDPRSTSQFHPFWHAACQQCRADIHIAVQPDVISDNSVDARLVKCGYPVCRL